MEKRDGFYVVPAFVDAHVQLTVAGNVAEAMLRGGVAAAIDLGAPEESLPLRAGALRVVFAGPLLTAPRGYPTQSWGPRHGLPVATADGARAAVRRLAAAGARFCKLAFDARYAMLDAEVARAAAGEAHRLGMQVAAHALDADAVARALDAGADVLAHTPRDELPAATLRALRGRWVISTLHAFGVQPTRLRALADAGVRVAYGTDLGNEDTRPGIDARELRLLQAAGVDPLGAAAAAAELAGVSLAGCQLGVRALDAESLAAPAWVMIDGKMLP